jgi:hypothetical protein
MSGDPDNLPDVPDMPDDDKPEVVIPDDDVYAASWEAMAHIIVPEGLTPAQCHQFWACVEVHAYYERKSCLSRSCGVDTDHRDSHMRKQIVVAFHLHEDAELVNAELQRWHDGDDGDDA